MPASDSMTAKKPRGRGETQGTTMTDDRERKAAAAKFKKSERATEGAKAMADYSYCVTNFGVRSERRSMGNVRASWRERPPISVASLQSSSERGVQAATADPLGW